MNTRPPAKAILKVIHPGLCTLVVDGGRPHCRSLGVPVGGAADRTAFALGNALVGNPPDAAALEVALAGPTLVADAELACVLFGAPFAMTGAGRTPSAGKTFTLRAGEVLHVGGTATGARAYFCVGGGLQTPVVLGSRSSLEPLRAGAELPCLSGSLRPRFGRFGEEPPPSRAVLRVMDGPQAMWFCGDDFYGGSFVVEPASNRMGVRLKGNWNEWLSWFSNDSESGRPDIRLAESTPESLAREMASEPVCPGSVQVTHDGQCIILGVDGQTIGGYPKIAQVVSADLDALGQLRPGDCVAFRRVPLAEAEALYREKRARLREWLKRLRAAEVVADTPRGS